jgi:hypothetical protein
LPGDAYGGDGGSGDALGGAGEGKGWGLPGAGRRRRSGERRTCVVLFELILSTCPYSNRQERKTSQQVWIVFFETHKKGGTTLLILKPWTDV